MTQEPVLPSVAQARALVAVIEGDGYSAGASALGLERSTVWRQLERLGNAIGLPLFEPVGTDRVIPTPYARSLVDAAKLIERGALEFTSLVSKARGQLVGEISVGAYPAVVANVVAPALGLFAGLPEFESVTVRIPSVTDDDRSDGGGSLIHRLKSGALDLAIGPSDMVDASLLGTDLYGWKLVASDPAGLLRGHRRFVTSDELLEVPILISPEGHTSRRLFDETLAASGRTARIAFETSSVEALIALAEQGQGVAILPDDNLGGRLGSWVRTLRPHPKGPSLDGRYSVYSRVSGNANRDDHPLEPIHDARRAMVDVLVKAAKSFRNSSRNLKSAQA